MHASMKTPRRSRRDIGNHDPIGRDLLKMFEHCGLATHDGNHERLPGVGSKFDPVRSIRLRAIESNAVLFVRSFHRSRCKPALLSFIGYPMLLCPLVNGALCSWRRDSAEHGGRRFLDPPISQTRSRTGFFAISQLCEHAVRNRLRQGLLWN
jgi:hypothetical protein